jgi:membrane peptidoglycan carboxypeptidase
MDSLGQRSSPLLQHESDNSGKPSHWNLSWIQSSLNGGILTAGQPLEFQRIKLGLKGPPRWVFWGLIGSFLTATVILEVRTAAFQSRFFYLYGKQLIYTIEPGPSSRIVFPQGGPFNLRRGYTQIPRYQQELEANGFAVTEQSRFSTGLEHLTKAGISPPFKDPVTAGLLIRSSGGTPLYTANSKLEFYRSYEEIPPMIVEALLFMENRELELDSAATSANPAVEWDRLAKAGLSYVGRELGLPLRLEGGSTLATQLEKYRYSPEGRTFSAGEKLRQMLGASLKVYRTGPDTRMARREIVLDYLNTVPLSAAAGYGEINGLGAGLHAWFGVGLADVNQALQLPGLTYEKVMAFRQVLTLLAAVRGPSYYLLQDRAALEARAHHYIGLMKEAGLIDPHFAEQLETAPVHFTSQPRISLGEFSARQKALSSIRSDLGRLLGVSNLYDLDRLDLEVQSTIDSNLQDHVDHLFAGLKNPEFLDTHGLRQERLLSQGDPNRLIYSLLLYEKTPQANILRVQADNYPGPLDINEGIKMELGSTAKLRTLAHYLGIVTSLFEDPMIRNVRTELPRDPITTWVSQTLRQSPDMSLETLLQKALNRTYSASPGEVFFTGGGTQAFVNFDPNDNGRRLTVREATRRSTNLVFIRLMRDLVTFHQARLGYDPEAVLNDETNPVRKRLLQEIADEEARQTLWRVYQKFYKNSTEAILKELLGKRLGSQRHLAMLFFAWKDPAARGNVEEGLANWLVARGGKVSAQDADRLIRAYGNSRLTLADFGYLLGVHPLEVWAAGQLWKEPGLSWDQLWDRSTEARQVSSAWLFLTRNRRAQDLRLRIRFEQDAFARMTPYWQKLGFPFDHLVPSLATAIGNSSDRPAALAELMGIIVNDGGFRPTIRFKTLSFAQNTPYHTVMAPKAEAGTRVMSSAVARAITSVLAEVVSGGTARRLFGAFTGPHGEPVVAGGKTGSGDNRYKTFSRGGGLLSSRAVNRTATFVFYVGDRYYGVITASVLGQEAGAYRFTSALPVSVLKLLAPAINERLASHPLRDEHLRPDPAMAEHFSERPAIESGHPLPIRKGV